MLANWTWGSECLTLLCLEELLTFQWEKSLILLKHIFSFNAISPSVTWLVHWHVTWVTLQRVRVSQRSEFSGTGDVFLSLAFSGVKRKPVTLLSSLTGASRLCHQEHLWGTRESWVPPEKQSLCVGMGSLALVGWGQATGEEVRGQLTALPSGRGAAGGP